MSTVSTGSYCRGMAHGVRRRAAALVLTLLATGLAVVGLSAPAQAVAVDVVAIPGAQGTYGVAVTADGAAWVAAPGASTGSLARVAPDGTVTQVPLTGQPVSVAVVAGRLWVTMTEQRRIAIVNPASPAVPTYVEIQGTCGPVGVVDGGNGKAYVSLPKTGACSKGSVVSFDAAAPGSSTLVTDSVSAYDLAVGSGQLFVPDYDGDKVVAIGLGSGTTTGTYTAASGSGLEGITATSSGQIYVTFGNTGGIGTRLAANGSGDLAVVTGGLNQPFGIAQSGSDLYVAASARTSGTPGVLVRRADGTSETLATPAGSQPNDVAVGTDGVVWVSDAANARVFRLTSLAPRVTAPTLSGTTVTGTVNPGGEATNVRVEYGPTTAYGSTATGPTLNGTTDQPVSVALSGLQPGTTYHLRLVATNARGTAYGADQVLTTVTPRLPAKVRLTKNGVAVKKLLGGEKVTLACKACPKKARKDRATAKKPGKLVLGKALRTVRLKPGTKLVVTVRKDGYATTTTTIVVRKGKKPRLT
jgi:streptogramin lyase